MTKAELNEIMFALDDLEERECQMCDEYVKLNPQDKRRRENDRNLYRLAILQARYEIKRRIETGHLRIA